MADRLLPGAANNFVQGADSTPPTVGGSAFNSLEENFGGTINLGIEKGVVPKNNPVSNWFENAFNRINYENQKEKELTSAGQLWARKTVSFIPAVIGAASDPVGLALGGFLGKGATLGIRALAPAMAVKQAQRRLLIKQLGEREAVRQLPRTASEVAAAGAHGGAVMLGYSVPRDVLNAYNQDERTLDYKQLAKESGANGALGIAFGVAGYGAGVLWHKVFSRTGSIPKPNSPEALRTLNNLQAKLDNKEISQTEHDLLKDFYINPANPTLNDRFATWLANRDHNIDKIDHKALFTILGEDDMEYLKSIYPNELNDADIATDKSGLSQYTLHNMLDRMRDNPEMIDGLRGASMALDEKLSHREAMTKKFDEILDTNLLKELHEKMPFDQDDIFDSVYKSGIFYEANQQPIPFIVPSEVERAIKNTREQELAEYKRRLFLDYEYKKKEAEEISSDTDFYHGSASLDELENFDVNRMDPNSLFGAGLYLTDRKEIAMTYSRSFGYRKSASDLLPGKIFKVKFKTKPKLIDIERKPDPKVFDVIQKEAKKHGYDVPNKFKNYKLDKLYRKMREDMAITIAEGEYYFNMGDILRDINLGLEKAGFSGYLHVGGKYLGKGKRLHNVAVVFGGQEGEGINKRISNPIHHLKQEEVDIGKDFEEKVNDIRSALKLKHPRELLLSAKDELLNIKDKLLTEKGLKDNFQETREYKRLVELSEVWHNAQTLLDRINLEHEYERQQAFHDVAQAFTSVLDSSIERFADSGRVLAYLKERINNINRAFGDASYSGQGGVEKKSPSEIISQQERLPSNHKELLAQYDEDVENVKAHDLSEEYKMSRSRFDNFNENQSALKQLVDCFRGIK